MINFNKKPRYHYEDLLQLVKFLRSEDGCEWDHAQTHQSIRRNFLEEAYEACEGMDRDDPTLMQEEFGDVLLQVVFHADIEQDRGHFSMDDVCDGICKKLVFRHPHLFGGEAEDWDALKQKEKGAKTPSDLMDGVARSLPALIRAEKLQEKSARAGLQWHSAAEAAEFAAEQLDILKTADGTAASEALGKALFAIVGAGVLKELDPESELQESCEAFIRRFRQAEQSADLADTMHRFWCG